MIALYNLGIFIIRCAAYFASFFNDKAKQLIAGQKNLWVELPVWVHCASLGEFEQGRPVIDTLHTTYPQHAMLITFFSPSGYVIRKNYKHADYVFYLPWDTATNAQQFVNIVKPVLAIFIKYEFWHHHINALYKQRVPVLSVSSRFRASQIFFKRYGGFYRQIIRRITHLFVQDGESVKLLNSIGVTQCTHAGDTRFDSVTQLLQEPAHFTAIEKFKGDATTLVAGSCWPEDMRVLARFINSQPTLKFIIAPHEISASFMQDIEVSLPGKCTRLSAYHEGDYQVMIIDNVGMLSRLYRYGNFAYVGGAFGKGLHNILEPACYGIPVFFGNRQYKKFQEANDLIARRGAFAVADANELTAQFQVLNNKIHYQQACNASRDYVLAHTGATSVITKYCAGLLTKN